MSHLVDLRKKPTRPSSSAGTTRQTRTLQSQRVSVPIHAGQALSTPPSAAETPQKSQKIISWKASSFFYNPQKRYFSLTIIALLFGASAVLIFQKDSLLAVFLALSSAVLILYSNKKPDVSDVEINESAVLLDDKTYYYKELKSFWIDYTPGGPKELSLEAKKWFVPYVKISIENQNPIQIRSWLINFLPEKEHQNSLIDVLGRSIGL